MTTEEKVRAYDEALEKAKQELKACGSLDSNAAKQIFRLFPELKENEDEKIIEEIIGFIFDKTSTYEERERSNIWLTWLEKQKSE